MRFFEGRNMRPFAKIAAKSVLVLGLLLFVSKARATVIWNEAINGNLSASGSSPTPFTLAAGTNSIIGTVTGGTKPDDWVEFTIPAGLQLSQDILESYVSTDQQGFTGVIAGSSYSGSINVASAYLGYSHFGTGATNGSLPATNLVGVDLLALMGNNVTISPGSQGFTPPLSSGNYVFLIQQLGAQTNFQFDYVVTPVPEPSALQAIGLGVTMLLPMMRKWARAI
jgi:hypothetical protein